jgi:hypothetical protein
MIGAVHRDDHANLPKSFFLCFMLVTIIVDFVVSQKKMKFVLEWSRMTFSRGVV